MACHAGSALLDLREIQRYIYWRACVGGQYNIAGIKLPFGIFPNLKDHRYDGYLYGGGLTLGHQWILNKRWSIEAAIGAGYARVHYDKYNCGECGSKIETKNSNYWGVTKAALSIIYFIH